MRPFHFRSSRSSIQQALYFHPRRTRVKSIPLLGSDVMRYVTSPAYVVSFTDLSAGCSPLPFLAPSFFLFSNVSKQTPRTHKHHHLQHTIALDHGRDS